MPIMHIVRQVCRSANRLRSKIIGTFAGISLCLAIVSIVGLIGISQIHDRFTQLNSNAIPDFQTLTNLRSALMDIEHDIYHANSATTPDTLQVALTSIDNDTQRIKQLATSPIVNAGSRAAVEAFQQSLSSLIATTQQIAQVDTANSPLRLTEAMTIMNAQWTPQFDTASSHLEGMIAQQQQVIDARESDVQRAYMLIITLISGLGAAAILGGWLLGYFLKRSVYPALARIRTAAANLRQERRDLEKILDTTLQRRDEIGDISRALLNMRRGLNSLFSHIAAQASMVEEEVKAIEHNHYDTAFIAAHVIDSIERVDSDAGEQNALVTNVSGDIQRLERQSQTLQAASREAMHVMSQIKDQIATTATQVNAFGELSEQIGQITQAIDAIADQTNLLAMNATIKAARAGEDGIGFAVIAEEASLLAKLSIEATRDINEIVNKAQVETSETAEAMNAGVQQIDAGMTLAKTTTKQAQTLQNGVQQIRQSLSGISAIGESNVQSITQTMYTAHAITVQIEDAQALAHSLYDAAQQLEMLTAGFKEEVEIVVDSTPNEIVEAITPVEIVVDSTPDGIVEAVTPDGLVADSTPDRIVEAVTPDGIVAEIMPDEIIEAVMPVEIDDDITPEIVAGIETVVDATSDEQIPVPVAITA
jgi:methyl-accepting chemotaxis protein